MKASYRQLMGEHEAIEEAARCLLMDLDDARLSSGELTTQLGELARFVEDHIEVENTVVTSFDRERLSGPWITAWHDGLTEFERLKADWIGFLRAWDHNAIDRDRGGFRRSAEAILGRLLERLKVETQAFYATALQTGAIELR